ncbi:MAG: hypothetical protein DRJ35_04505 [Thermoprotei archaeon]|nr:MAG: hypothetical protein DRJ35_04505 [Thermoprotei archaeon]
MFVLAIIYSVVAIVLLLPFITELVRMVSSMHGTPSHLQIEELMYMLVKNLVVMTVIMVLMRLFFEPSYIFPFTNWQGALSSVSGSLGKVLSFVSDDPLSFIAFFLLFLFPEVLNYLWFDVFVKNPLFSNLMSLAGFVKTLLVDPLYILALLIYLRDRNDPDVNISDEFLIPPPPPPPQPYQWQSYQPPAVQEPTVEGSVDESSRKESISYSDSEREEG